MLFSSNGVGKESGGAAGGSNHASRSSLRKIAGS